MPAIEGETILAVSSPSGAGAAAVLRLSGPTALSRVAALARDGGPALLEAHGSDEVRVVLDLEGLALPTRISVWRAPRSYTREDVVEVVLPGSPPLVALAARVIVSSPGAREACVRWARPGEFTLRAYLNGRLDLTQAESVAALIGAAGEDEARASQRGMRGELRDRIDALARDLLEVLALIEAALDFPDEDLPQVSPGALLGRVRECIERIDSLRRSSALRIPSGGALRVVITGFPNAGKSSLLNAILGRRAAITSGVPGTTRDPVRGVTVQGGRRIEWIDVAGALDSKYLTLGGETEDERPIWDAVRRLARVEMTSADCILWVVDPCSRPSESLAQFRLLEGRSKRLVIQKCDLLPVEERDRYAALEERPLVVSARQHVGLDSLVTGVLDATLAAYAPGVAASPRFLVSAHQESQLIAVGEALSRAAAALSASRGLECAAADLRDASLDLDDLSGLSSREAVLDLVFSRFCIGK